jgi:hypothetical protein
VVFNLQGAQFPRPFTTFTRAHLTTEIRFPLRQVMANPSSRTPKNFTS